MNDADPSQESAAPSVPPRFEPLHLTRFKARGIDPDLAYAEGARSLDEVQVQTCTRVPVKGAGLAYHYSHLDFGDHCRNYSRVHLDDSKANGKKVVCPPKVVPPAFFLSTAAGHDGPWFVCESPEKALALATHGFREAVGLGGVDAGLLEPGTLELQKLVRHFIKKGQLVYVVFDAGRRSNPRVAVAEARVSVALRNHGCDVRLLALPLADGQDQGPDDFLATHGAGAFQKLIDESEPGDPVGRAALASSSGRDAVRALLDELPFRCALVVGGDPLVDAVVSTLGAHASRDEVVRARAEGLADLARAHVFERGSQVEVAHKVLADLRADVVYADGHLYRYDGARWATLDEDAVVKEVIKYDGALVRTKDGFRPLNVSFGFSEGVVKMVRTVTGRQRFFEEAMPGVAFEDCFLRVQERYLIKESPNSKYRARHAYDFRYDDVIRAPRFLGLLRSVWEGDNDAGEKAACLQEYVGACLVGLGARLKKAVIFSGDTDSGKSTLLSVLQSIFPQGAVAAVRPGDFGNDYHRAQLVGVLANFVSELPETDWLEPSAFKALTGDDLINARNPYGRPFSFTSVAGHIYAANSLPRINDRSEASWNRLVVLTFPHRFHLMPTEGQRQAIRGLARDIVNEEREGVVAWAVEGLRRLLANKMVLTPVGTSEQVVQTLRDESDQLRLFLDEQLTLDPAGNPEIAFVYSVYVDWARETHHQLLSKTRFAREFLQTLKRATGLADPRSQNAKSRRTYRGIKVKRPESHVFLLDQIGQS